MALIAEREILVALLALTKDGPCPRDRMTVRATVEVVDSVLEKLVQAGLISEENGMIGASKAQRLGMAVKAIEAGADAERVARAVSWLEFEEMVAHVFEENGYSTRRRFRFKAEGRQWEIDVLALRRPMIVCSECKHWLRGMGDSAASKTVETHLEKVRIFSENIGRLAEEPGLREWDGGVVLPVAMSLTNPPTRFYHGVPAVSIHELPDFLGDVKGYLGDLVSFKVELPSEPRPFQTKLRR